MVTATATTSAATARTADSDSMTETMTVARTLSEGLGLSSLGFAAASVGIGALIALVVFLISPPVLSRIYSVFNVRSDGSVTATRDALTITVFASAAVVGVVELPFEGVASAVVGLSVSLVLVLWLWVAYHIGSPLIERAVEYRYDTDLVPIVLNFWVISILVVAVIGLFEVWNIDLTPLLASAGVAGIVLGLAARETISNFFGSVALYADNTYEVGDYIEVDGESGFVEKISIRSTRLRTLDNNAVTIPNSNLHNSIVKNKGAPTVSHRIEINIGVGYGEDLDEVEGLIKDVIEDVAEENKGLVDSERIDDSSVFVKEFGDSAVVFRVFAWTEQPIHEPRLRDRLNKKIYDVLLENGIEIPYPQRSVHIRDENEEEYPEKREAD